MSVLSRRRFVGTSATWLSRCLAVGVGGLPLTFSSEAVAEKKLRARKSTARWVDELIARQRRSPELPAGVLHLGRFKDPVYFLTKPITWKPNEQQKGRLAAADVPPGFVTDFASIPRAFWSALRPDGEYAFAAVVHDYLYWMQDRSREEADETFKIAMQDFEIASRTVAVVYGAVRQFGNFAWTKNARSKRAGEKRILKAFPEDPRITWQQWKSRPGVFVG
jgi:hypothetical protein